MVPSGCSPERMPGGGAALPLLCNLICSLQSLLSQFKDYCPGVWVTKQIVINRVRLLVKNRIYPVVFIIYITFRQIPPCHFIPSLFAPLNVNLASVTLEASVQSHMPSLSAAPAIRQRCGRPAAQYHIKTRARPCLFQPPLPPTLL